MKLIVGLGNPGERYEATRHNAGFWLVERFAAESRTGLRKDAKFQALVGRHEASGAWLMLPQSHMNLSGRPVQMLAAFFRIAPADILVVHDELDFPPGIVRMKQGGGAAGHNGLKDISARLGAQDYWRLRLGIGHPGDRNAVSNYVLNRPTLEERVAVDAAIAAGVEILPQVLAGDLQGAMLKLHSRPDPERPAAVEKPEKPKKQAKALQAAAAQPQAAAKPAAEAATQPAKEAKGGALGGFLKKFLPDSGQTPKK
jgi:PTH1 family peptidyl-tRNA hydrolase